METQQPATYERKWYDRGWVIAVTLLLFFPVGLYALYKNRPLSGGKKTAIFAGFLVFAMIAAAGDEEASDSTASAAGGSDATEQVEAEPEQSSATPAEPAPAPKPDLELLSHKWDYGEYGNDYIVGTIKNNTGSTYSYAQIQINLYDAGGAQVGSAMDNISDLEPGGRWKFKAIAMDDNVNSYKVKGISGW